MKIKKEFLQKKKQTWFESTKKINPPSSSIKKIAGIINPNISHQQTRPKLERMVFESIQESNWGTSCKSMWIKQIWNTSHTPSLPTQLH